ncbi:MAG: UDP-N-acetylglucosamine 1-carboxyvinyltransferase [Lunatimonas sp.]|uniref:UDP-N-acetylglucosamine 1-carboxyvinyltransferase n=1 Tax=Lunatimonas sp. TaxID=2060141 RepID=UPI00263AB83F|nr:UDP-N-acetylglucosamine 1-carboxyvinyltransferase [Lunatimonas sp.]MCC5936794.1 UDP-N-acetylglucosamine 1-carboxyvinyltransferase [Lunatimonas sp.]
MKSNITAKISGGQVPKGKVTVSGAKNSATRLLAASLVADEKVVLENFPTELVDANYKFDFIRKCGGLVNVDREKEIVEIESGNLIDVELDDYNYPIRTTYLLVPGLIKRNGIARIPYPGGCKIGNRGYDLHIMVWENLGAKVEEKENYIQVTAPNGFKAGEIDFPITTIGGTESALICASTIAGTTYIKNAYISPEVQNLIDFLRTLGSKIKVVGNSFIEVTGKSFLQGSLFQVMPDRIEALTWLVYGILSGGDITIEDVPFTAMEIPLIHLHEAGIDYYRNTRSIHITPDCLQNGIIQPFELATGTHPGIISDMQPFYVLLGLHADGISRIFDYRYPERIKYCEELNRFYPGQLSWEKGAITTRGKHNISPNASTATSTDLRGSMALLMAALLGQGDSTVNNAEMALRGYNKLQEKLAALGIKLNLIQE